MVEFCEGRLKRRAIGVEAVRRMVGRLQWEARKLHGWRGLERGLGSEGGARRDAGLGGCRAGGRFGD